MPGPGKETEICTLSGAHSGHHNWPSLPKDPGLANSMMVQSALRIFGTLSPFSIGYKKASDAP